MPIYDVSGAVATVADADRETAWQELLDVDLLKLGREAPLVGMLGALRMLPDVVGHLLHGEAPAKPPESMRLRDLPSIPMYEGRLDPARGAPGRGDRAGPRRQVLAAGDRVARIKSADEFRDFNEPGFAKTVYDLSVRELEANKTLLSGLMRTATTDKHAPLVSPLLDLRDRVWSAHPRWCLLDSARRAAEGDRDDAGL